MKFINKKIPSSKKILSVFSSNSFSNKFLLTLFFAAFIIIAIDLGSEMAAQKDEIGTALAVFEEGYTEIILAIDILPDIDRPLLYEISLKNLLPSENIFKNSVRDRAPPEVI